MRPGAAVFKFNYAVRLGDDGVVASDCGGSDGVIKVGSDFSVEGAARTSWETVKDFVLVGVICDVGADHYIAFDAGVEEG